MANRMIAAAVALMALFSGVAQAGVTVYDKDGKKIEVGARVQLQYMQTDPDGGESVDDLFLRRLRPYIQGTVTEDWLAKVQFDLGKSSGDNEVAIKDAFMRYTGLENHSLTIGNAKAPFSREFLASSKRQQLIERSFAGDHNFGSPDRQLGVRLDGRAAEKKVTYAASLGAQSHDPSASKMDFDTPVNEDSDWNEGWLLAGRVDFHPLGHSKFDRGDFHSDEWRFNVSLAGFTWDNDDDNNTYTDAMGMSTDAGKADLDSADGIEVSAGVRGAGLSADVEYQMISGDTVDAAFTGGLYADGTTDLDILAVEGGYMFPGSKAELVVGFDSLDADSYETAFERTSFGVNWFWNKHKAKLQLTFRMGENVDGVDGVDADELFGQVQFVF